MEHLRFQVEEETARLDAFLVSRIEGLSKNSARELCEQDKVLVNGVPGRSGGALSVGDLVEVQEYLGPVSAHALELSLPADFAVLYEDDQLLVVAKPRKMASTRQRHEDPRTLADCIASCSAKCVQASPDPREAGLVQRLDFYTSGVVVAGKTRESWQDVRKQLFAERVEKTYLAFVEKRSIKNRFTVNVPLAQSKDGRSMVAVKERNEKEPIQLSAVTEVTVIGQFELGSKWFSVVRAKGKRVRRHQIRVHLASVGHPLVGDHLYGAEHSLNDALPWAQGDEEGFLLHAQDIRLQHPVSGKEMRFQCSSDYFRKLSKLF